MATRSPYEMDRLRQFLHDYQVRDIKVETAQRYQTPGYSFNFSNDVYPEYITEHVNMYNMTIPEDRLDKIVGVVAEFDDLMRDPETAKLLMEARFISRLKRGRY